MKTILYVVSGAAMAVLAARAQEKLPVLKVGSEVYSNVVVLDVTATHIQFSHSQGLGNAKLKHLDPEAQKHFGFNSAKARDLELKQREANAQFRTNFAQGRIGEYSTANLPGSRRVQEQADPEPQLDSGQRTSLVGQQAPELVVEKWLTLAPDTSRKFVLIEFLGTWCGACRRSIPLLNSISEEYEDRLVVIGVSAEREIDVRNQKSPRINYAVAIDSKQRTYRAAGVRAIPHVLLIDPRGVVRYAGSPSSFEDRRILEKILDKYAD